VVTGVIEQLEKTGNKPQLVKELAAVLCNSLNIVERYAPEQSSSPRRTPSARARADSRDLRKSSANPQAIISSRLNAYLRRPWTALAPCPIAKTLVPTHPRRIYFYLTNIPHQPLPESSSESPLPSNRRHAVISPSLSSDEDAEARKRAALSPSPEVDLSVPDEFDGVDGGPPTPAGSFSGRSSLGRDGSHTSGGVELMGHSHRTISPPLEGDEKEFTQTASVMQSKRSQSRERQYQALTNPDGDTVRMSTEDESGEGGRVPSTIATDESEESAFARNSEAAAALFGHAQSVAAAAAGHSGPLSSPLVRPSTTASLAIAPKRPSVTTDHALMDLDAGKADEGGLNLGLGWASDMISPEKVDLEELDDLFGDGF
jgi:hypothetical protein